LKIKNNYQKKKTSTVEFAPGGGGRNKSYRVKKKIKK